MNWQVKIGVLPAPLTNQHCCTPRNVSILRAELGNCIPNEHESWQDTCVTDSRVENLAVLNILELKRCIRSILTILTILDVIFNHAKTRNRIHNGGKALSLCNGANPLQDYHRPVPGSHYANSLKLLSSNYVQAMAPRIPSIPRHWSPARSSSSQNHRCSCHSNSAE